MELHNEKQQSKCKYNCPADKCKSGLWSCLKCDFWISEKYVDIEKYV